MDNGLFNILLEYLNIVFMVFSTVLFALYFLMAYLATRNSIHYKNKNSFGDISKTMGSQQYVTSCCVLIYWFRLVLLPWWRAASEAPCLRSIYVLFAWCAPWLLIAVEMKERGRRRMLESVHRLRANSRRHGRTSKTLLLLRCPR